MNIYFLILLIIGVLGLGINLAKHGERKNDKYNFWAASIGFSIQIILVYMAMRVGL